MILAVHTPAEAPKVKPKTTMNLMAGNLSFHLEWYIGFLINMKRSKLMKNVNIVEVVPINTDIDCSVA